MSRKKNKVNTQDAYDEFLENEQINKEFSNYISVKLSEKQY